MDLLSRNFLELHAKEYTLISCQSITLPECPICHEEYSIDTPEREPYGLQCGHAICNGCFSNLSTQTSSGTFKYGLLCCQCQAHHIYSQKSWENPLKAFLREMSQLSSGDLKPKEELKIQPIQPIQPIQLIQPNSIQPNRNEGDLKSCENCGNEFSLLEMFLCKDCDIKICALCSMRKHRSHEIVDLKAEMEKINQLFLETHQTVTPQIKAYDVCFPDLHKDLINHISNVQKKLIAQIDKIETLNFDSAKREQEKCLGNGGKFEEICEKYLSDLRTCNTRLENLFVEIDYPLE
ncbi:unnamed protein product, partial [Mesorhabditis belari]|uniref:RING-type domain-containing protein n=1 Tax=Mesorhabditis belari TaxID=2138241 RepID=A0AAF3F8Z0_9BILA